MLPDGAGDSGRKRYVDHGAGLFEIEHSQAFCCPGQFNKLINSGVQDRAPGRLEQEAASTPQPETDQKRVHGGERVSPERVAGSFCFGLADGLIESRRRRRCAPPCRGSPRSDAPPQLRTGSPSWVAWQTRGRVGVRSTASAVARSNGSRARASRSARRGRLDS